MKFPLNIVLVVLLMCACNQKKQVDLLIVNAKVYTVNEQFSTEEAFAVHQGKFVGIGSTEDILDQYNSDNIIDANNKAITPGLIDGHCHFYNLGLTMQHVNLVGTTSFNEVVNRVKNFDKQNNNSDYILGRGWDQNDWPTKEFPDNTILNKLYPKTPVALIRIDGHALLANQAALTLAGINEDTVVEGGEIIKEKGKLTGILIDNAMAKVVQSYPKLDLNSKINALKSADQYCLSYGLTTLDDAGLEPDIINLIDSLQKANSIKSKVYAMVSLSKQNLEQYLVKGIYKTDKLNVRSFKVYADGALGSRGATLKKSYSDKDHFFGAMVTSLDSLKLVAKLIANSEFQMNTHAIGDSANAFMLKVYTKALKSQTNRRWRIEHAQIIDSLDFEYFTDIIPSVQPTHATSDMYWAEDRVGPLRIQGAYAFKKLLDIKGKIVLGTDFPVEQVNPMLTFYAAVARQDLKGFPQGGFLPHQKLSREDALKGMTIWPAFANFEELEKGSIEVGKQADFIVLNQDIMEIEINKVPETKVISTYIDGELVFTAQ